MAYATDYRQGIGCCGDVPDEVSEPSIELRLEIAQRVAELSGWTVEEVLAEDDVLGD